MTCRERHRQQLIRTIQFWMHQHGVLFVLVVLFSAVLPQTVFAADPVKLVSKESTAPTAVKESLPAAVKEALKPQKVAPAKKSIELPSVSKEEAKAEGVVKTLQGTVSGVSNYGLAVEFEGGTREMWADLMKETTLEKVKKIRDIQIGDTVEIAYKELKNNSKRLLQKVKLVRRKPKELESLEAEPGA